jgi:hypothetical protein
MGESQAYPLSWPEGWPRTAAHNRKWWNAPRKKSMEEVTDFLAGELSRLGARKAVLSTNVSRRLDGRPYSNQAQPNDPGAAVYFELKGKPVSLACDKWLRVEENIWAIGKHIEALRGQDRWGVGSVEQAFRGYMALPAVGESSASTWWQVLGVPINAEPDAVREAYRLLVKKHHPDKGGDAEMFRRVMKAMEAFEQSLKHLTAAVV